MRKVSKNRTKRKFTDFLLKWKNKKIHFHNNKQ